MRGDRRCDAAAASVLDGGRRSRQLHVHGRLKPRTGAWTVLVNGKPVTPAGVTFVGKHVQLRLPAGVYSTTSCASSDATCARPRAPLLSAFDAKPANRSSPGCSEQLGTLVEGPDGTYRLRVSRAA
jgi:hypothetical protein